MRHLPTLPGCGAPSSVRIEVYSPTPSGGLHGSLDAVAYACDRDQGAVLAMLDDAGLTGHVDPDRNAARAMGRPCGHLFRYDAPAEPAGPADHNGEPVPDAFVARNKVPEPGPVRHPRWCVRGDEVTRVHRSHLTDITDDMTVRIEQPHQSPDPAIVIRTVGRSDLTLPLDVAAALTKQLRIAVSLAGMDL